MPIARADMGVADLNGLLYVVGGSGAGSYGLATVDAYDPSTNRWIHKAPMPTGRAGLGVGVVNGTLYAVGGFVPGLGSTPTLEAYNPITDAWTTKAPMPTSREFLGVGVVGGLLYAVGGCGQVNGGTSASIAVEAYDPLTNTWTAKAQMPTALCYIALGVVNGKLYVVGGAHTGVVESYDPIIDTWTTKAPLPTPRSALGVAVVFDVLYAVGGIRMVGPDSGYLSTVESYDAITDTWTTKHSMTTGRSELGVGALNNTVYALGGYATLGPQTYGFVATNETYRP